MKNWSFSYSSKCRQLFDSRYFEIDTLIICFFFLFSLIQFFFSFNRYLDIYFPKNTCFSLIHIVLITTTNFLLSTKRNLMDPEINFICVGVGIMWFSPISIYSKPSMGKASISTQELWDAIFDVVAMIPLVYWQ